MAKTTTKPAPQRAVAPTRQSAPAPAASGGGNGNVDSSLLKRLKQMKERWAKAKEESKKGGFSGTTLQATPSGARYKCSLSDARMGSNDNGDFVVFEFTCVEGDQTGEKAIRFANMDDDDKIVWLQRDLRRMGVEVDDFDPEDLPNILEQLKAAAPVCRITVRENGEYINVYIDKLLEDESGGVGEVAAPEAEAEAEDTGEAEGGEPASEELEVGTEVSYKMKGKKYTGIIKKDNGDGTFNIRNDDTKKIDESIDVDVIEILATVE